MDQKNNKAILLVRVSTERQNFDEQERELYELALADGFSDKNIIPICEKESGIKLKEEERRGLNRMKEEIDKGGVSCVYAWEVSRIGRKKKVIFSITEYLAEKGIQLIIKVPSIKLLDEDNSINDGAETILTLFAQFAESEMRTKQFRWRRTRAANSKAGIWNGGASIRYGYKIDDNKRFIIDEEKASIIRLIYDLYTTTNLGQNNIRKELISRGIKVTQNRIQRILNFRGYTGETVRQPYWQDGKKKVGHELRYPAIIGTELFEAAQKKKETANSLVYKGSNYYFGKGLLRCPCCGHLYLAYKHSALYMCMAHRHDNKDIVKCDNSTSININVLDTVLWDATICEYIKDRFFSEADADKHYMEEIEVCKNKIEAEEELIKKVNDKADKYAEIYAEGRLSKEKYTKVQLKIDAEKEEIKREVMSSKDKIRQYQRIIEERTQPNVIETLKQLADAAFSHKQLMEMANLVHAYIQTVNLKQTDLMGNRTKEVTIIAVSGQRYEYAVKYECGGGHRHHYWKKCPQHFFPFDDIWTKIQPEIFINRSLGRTSTKDKRTPDTEILRNTEGYFVNP